MNCCLCEKKIHEYRGRNYNHRIRFKNRLTVRMTLESENGHICPKCYEVMMDAIVESRCLHAENLMPLIRKGAK